jgi:crotonobetainyl-CoA:carnitine CoA-transferase CaiB-like acyl-CoA transferase
VTDGSTAADGPLHGLRVIDAATVMAGPGIAARLGDFGADVIKVEHPVTGDSTRSLGWSDRGVTLWWKWIGRNKRPVTLDLSKPEGAELLVRLAETADVLIESFRPGTMERWGLGPDVLLGRNPRLVVVRISGFGQTGPYRQRPGFGTLAESVSGYAHMTGFPDGPPILPPIALADEVAALLGSYAVMLALYARDVGADGDRGRGQVIDLSLFEPLFQLTGPIAAAYDRLGVVPGRIGNAIAYAAPRGAYPTKDGRWIGVSGTTDSIARRIFAAIGRPELFDDERFATNEARVENVKVLDELIGAWTEQHTLEEAMAAFERFEAAAAPIEDVAAIVADPQYTARGTLVRVLDDELGDVLLADVQPKLSRTPGRIRHAGLPKGSATADVLAELGLTAEDVARLRDEGVAGPVDRRLER